MQRSEKGAELRVLGSRYCVGNSIIALCYFFEHGLHFLESKMKSTFLYPTLSGIIISIFSVLITFQLTTTENSNNRNVRVFYYYNHMSRYVTQDIISNFNSNIDFSDYKNISKYNSIFGYSENKMSTYIIRNYGNHEIKELKIALSSFVKAYIISKDSEEKISTESKEITKNILPGSSIKLIVISNDHTSIPGEKFLINGEALGIEIDSTFYLGNINIDMLKTVNDGILYFIGIVIIGAFSTILMLVFIVISIVCFMNPRLWIHFYDNDTIARSIAILNIIRRENPNKYDQIEALAKKNYNQIAKPE